MPSMSWHERAFCRSGAWSWFAQQVVVPWALRAETLSGDVLELGSGSGAMAAGILARNPGVRLTATDYDNAMVALASARLASYGERASVRQADAASLPFPEERFDAVLAFLMLHHVGRWEQALGEAARVLRPNGLLIGYDLLANRATRALHRLGHEHGERLIEVDSLESTLAALPLNAVTIRVSAHLVVRFRAAKQA